MNPDQCRKKSIGIQAMSLESCPTWPNDQQIQAFELIFLVRWKVQLYLVNGTVVWFGGLRALWSVRQGFKSVLRKLFPDLRMLPSPRHGAVRNTAKLFNVCRCWRHFANDLLDVLRAVKSWNLHNYQRLGHVYYFAHFQRLPMVVRVVVSSSQQKWSFVQTFAVMPRLLPVHGVLVSGEVVGT